ncbi:MAG TPA: thrombospondin type 3 repeat-containing protein, partial [Candidatus Sulfotelmatobacter sp.]|nr:thrombospondin type 3 repeat-containing protein [Candidatus Sulfotelmatobacter sp.]
NVATGDYAGGGGAFRCTLNRCLIAGNRATGSVGSGGGADQCTLNNCLVISNSAPYVGGLQICTANNCTIVGNSAAGGAGSWGGGAGNSTLNNCIVCYNYSPDAPDCGHNTSVSYCCVPTLQDGPRNFTNPPAFVDLAAGDFHLQFSSSCINSGWNASAPPGTDYDGHTRMVGSAVDVGAYEFAAPVSVISYGWLQQFGLPTDGSADFVDTDGDGLNNWQEWRANTDPTTGLSALRVLSISNALPGVAVTWRSASNVTYYLDRSTNIGTQHSFSIIKAGIPSQGLSTTCTDSNAAPNAPIFYRVGVQ